MKEHEYQALYQRHSKWSARPTSTNLMYTIFFRTKFETIKSLSITQFFQPGNKSQSFQRVHYSRNIIWCRLFCAFFHVWTESESKYSTAKSKPEPTIGKVNIRKYFQFLTKKKPFFSEINLSILSHGKNRVLLYSSISPPPVFIVLGKKN